VADGITNRGRNWELRNSVWIAWTFMLGMLGWISFLYVAIRARRPWWALLGIPSLVLLVWFILFEDEPDGTTIDAISSIIIVTVWPFTIAAAFMIRPAYLRRIAGDVVGGVPLRREREIREQQALDQPGWTPPPSDLVAHPALRVDLNSAGVEQLAELPGMDEDRARRAVEERAARGGFSSVEAMGEWIGLKPHELVMLRDRATVAPRHARRAAGGSGRVVDY
jgi:hypothetical protein